MTQTLLQIINSAQAELGLPQAATVIGNPDATTTQMYALSKRVLDELRRRNRWVNMQFEFNLVVNPAIADTGTISSGSLNTITGLQSTTTAQLSAQPYAWAVAANSIPAAARVQSVGATSVVLDMQATGPSTNQPVQFGQDTYAMPTGFDWFNDRTMWDRTNRWELLGPDSPQMDQWHRSGIVAIGPRRHFRQLGPYANTFRLWPAPFELANPLQLVFEYLSIDAVYVNGSLTNFAEYFANDDDVPILDDQSIIMGIKWMFWQAKGFNYADMKNDWIDYVDRQAGRDGAAPTLALVKRARSILINSYQVQDGYFPGPVGTNSV
jgi:hypothetical protein